MKEGQLITRSFAKEREFHPEFIYAQAELASCLQEKTINKHKEFANEFYNLPGLVRNLCICH